MAGSGFLVKGLIPHVLCCQGQPSDEVPFESLESYIAEWQLRCIVRHDIWPGAWQRKRLINRFAFVFCNFLHCKGVLVQDMQCAL